MKLNPHLAFNGECEAAFRFYEQCFGGDIVTMLSYGNSPMAEQAPPLSSLRHVARAVEQDPGIDAMAIQEGSVILIQGKSAREGSGDRASPPG